MDSRLSDASHSIGSHRKAKFRNMYSKILLVRYGTHNLTSCKFVGRISRVRSKKSCDGKILYRFFGCGLPDQNFGFVKRSISFLNWCVRHCQDLKLMLMFVRWDHFSWSLLRCSSYHFVLLFLFVTISLETSLTCLPCYFAL